MLWIQPNKRVGSHWGLLVLKIAQAHSDGTCNFLLFLPACMYECSSSPASSPSTWQIPLVQRLLCKPPSERAQIIPAHGAKKSWDNPPVLGHSTGAAPPSHRRLRLGPRWHPRGWPWSPAPPPQGPLMSPPAKLAGGPWLKSLSSRGPGCRLSVWSSTPASVFCDANLPKKKP